MLLFSGELEDHKTAAKYFRSILSTDKFDFLPLVIEKGVASRLVYLIKNGNDLDLLSELLWSITNLACSAADQIKLIFDDELIVMLINLIASGPLFIAEQSIVV